MLGHRTLRPDDYVGIVKRRWLWIVLPLVIAPLLAFAITFILKPEYLSQTLVIIEQQTVPDDYVKPVVNQDLDAQLASMKEQILSRSRIEPLIDRFNLYPGMDMDDRVEAVRKDIGVIPIHSEIDRAGGLPGFYITFKHSDPHIAQQVCGEITSLFVSQNIQNTEQTAEGTTSFLASQLAEAKASLDQQDQKLAQFEKTYIGRLPGETDENMGMLQSLNTQLEAATQALAQLEQAKTYQQAMLQQQIQQLRTTGGVTKPVVDPREVELQNDEAEVAQLAQTYTNDYPDLIAARAKVAQLKAEIAKNPMPKPAASERITDTPELEQLKAAIQATNQGIDAKRAEQLQLQASINLYQQRIATSPLVEEQYKELTRDYQTAQQFYDNLLTKMNQSRMATDLEQRQEGEQFRVLDAPNLPDQPYFPKRWLFAAGGLAAGLLIGLLMVALIEYRDTAIRSERDIYAFLKLPTLAIISHIGDKPMPPPYRAQKEHRRMRETTLSAESGAHG